MIWKWDFLVWFSNSMQEKKTQRTSSMFTDSKQVKMMHYWQSSYGMLHSWQKNATTYTRSGGTKECYVLCYPQNCVIHTLPPLLFILQQNTLNHHPLNDKQNLESNFLEAPQSKVWWVAQKKWTLLSSTCTKEKWVCTPHHRIYIYRGARSLFLQSSAAMRSHYIIMPQSPKIESHVTLFALRWEESFSTTLSPCFCTFWRKKK